jgi:hypothetical protein
MWQNHKKTYQFTRQGWFLYVFMPSPKWKMKLAFGLPQHLILAFLEEPKMIQTSKGANSVIRYNFSKGRNFMTWVMKKPLGISKHYL